MSLPPLLGAVGPLDAAAAAAAGTTPTGAAQSSALTPLGLAQRTLQSGPVADAPALTSGRASVAPHQLSITLPPQRQASAMASARQAVSRLAVTTASGRDTDRSESGGAHLPPRLLPPAAAGMPTPHRSAPALAPMGLTATAPMRPSGSSSAGGTRSALSSSNRSGLGTAPNTGRSTGKRSGRDGPSRAADGAPATPDRARASAASLKPSASSPGLEAGGQGAKPPRTPEDEDALSRPPSPPSGQPAGAAAASGPLVHGGVLTGLAARQNGGALFLASSGRGDGQAALTASGRQGLSTSLLMSSGRQGPLSSADGMGSKAMLRPQASFRSRLRRANTGLSRAVTPGATSAGSPHGSAATEAASPMEGGRFGAPPRVVGNVLG